jgi:hypothetical protein
MRTSRLIRLAKHEPPVVFWPTHSHLQEICREGFARIQKIQNPLLDANYDFVLAITVLAGHVLQRSWRFGAFERITMSNIAHAKAHKDKVWLDKATKGSHLGIVLSHALTDIFFEYCTHYARHWRSLVATANATSEFFVLRNGKSILESSMSSRDVLGPAFLSSTVRALSSTEIRKIQVHAKYHIMFLLILSLHHPISCHVQPTTTKYFLH